MEIFKKLPKELINTIISYEGKVNYRNGIYINRIPLDDERYTILSSLRMPEVKYSNESNHLSEINYTSIKHLLFIECKDNNAVVKYIFFKFNSIVFDGNDDIVYQEYIRP